MVSRGDPGPLFSEYSSVPPSPRNVLLFFFPVPWDVSCGITELLRATTRVHAAESRKLLAPALEDCCDLKFVDAYNVLRSYRSA